MTPDRELYAQGELLWPDSETGPYLVRLSFSKIGDRIDVVGVEMWGQEPPTGEKWTKWLNHSPAEEPQRIASTTIRLPLDRLALPALNRLQAAAEVISRKPGSFSPAAQDAAKRARSLKSPRGGRPATYSNEHWASVATIYTTALASRGKPTSTVASRFNVSKSTAAKWVAHCRELGLLPPATKGRAAGRPIEEIEKAYPGLITHHVVRKDGSVEDVSVRPDDQS